MCHAKNDIFVNQSTPYDSFPNVIINDSETSWTPPLSKHAFDDNDNGRNGDDPDTTACGAKHTAATGREEEAGGLRPMTWGWNVDED